MRFIITAFSVSLLVSSSFIYSADKKEQELDSCRQEIWKNTHNMVNAALDNPRPPKEFIGLAYQTRDALTRCLQFHPKPQELAIDYGQRVIGSQALQCIQIEPSIWDESELRKCHAQLSSYLITEKLLTDYCKEHLLKPSSYLLTIIEKEKKS
jgi:hypothetical protein